MSKPFDDVTFKGLHMCQGIISGHQCVACSLHHGVFQLSTGEVWPQSFQVSSMQVLMLYSLTGRDVDKQNCLLKKNSTDSCETRLAYFSSGDVGEGGPRPSCAYSQAQGVPSRHADQVASTRESLWWNVLQTPPQGYLGESLFLCPPIGCSSHSHPWTDSQKDDGGGPQMWKSSWRNI